MVYDLPSQKLVLPSPSVYDGWATIVSKTVSLSESICFYSYIPTPQMPQMDPV